MSPGCGGGRQGDRNETHDAMKLGAFKALWPLHVVLALARAELAEVLGRLGHHILEEFEGDAA